MPNLDMPAEGGSASGGKTVAVSGGFDPVHIGHIRLLKNAKSLGDKLVVILNNDNWLVAKKGFAFMSENERKAILESIKYVDEVKISEHEKNTSDMSVVKELEKLKPEIFANGGDRHPEGDPVPEVELCKKLGIELAYNVGGEKAQSSSELVKRVRDLGFDPKNL